MRPASLGPDDGGIPLPFVAPPPPRRRPTFALRNPGDLTPFYLHVLCTGSQARPTSPPLLASSAHFVVVNWKSSTKAGIFSFVREEHMGVAYCVLKYIDVVVGVCSSFERQSRFG